MAMAARSEAMWQALHAPVSSSYAPTKAGPSPASTAASKASTAGVVISRRSSATRTSR
jgi:hypothetical protein